MAVSRKPSLEMIIDTVDEYDQVVGTIRRRDVLPSRERFRVAHVFLFNKVGDLLLQQLAKERDRHPLHWGSSVAAYLFSGESYRAAAVRRLGQELGVSGVPLRRAGATSILDSGRTKFVVLFSTVYDGPIVAERGHIEAVEFLPIEQIQAMKASEDRAFTPTFLHLLNFYLSLP